MVLRRGLSGWELGHEVRHHLEIANDSGTSWLAGATPWAIPDLTADCWVGQFARAEGRIVQVIELAADGEIPQVAAAHNNLADWSIPEVLFIVVLADVAIGAH